MSGDIEFMTAVVATLVGAGASVLGEYIRRRRESKEGEKTPNLEPRVESLTQSLQKSTSLISEIQEEIERRHELVTKLKSDTEHYEALSKLKEKEAEAVAQLLRGVVRSDNRSSFYKGVLVNFIFFVLGVGASYGIASFI